MKTVALPATWEPGSFLGRRPRRRLRRSWMGPSMASSGSLRARRVASTTSVNVRAGPGGAGQWDNIATRRRTGRRCAQRSRRVGQLLGGGVGVDGACRTPTAVLHRHEEDGRDHGDAGCDVIRSCARSCGRRPRPCRQHRPCGYHGAEVGHVGDLLAGPLEGDVFWRAGARTPRRSARGRRPSHGAWAMPQVEAELAGALGDAVGAAHEGDAGDAGGEDSRWPGVTRSSSSSRTMLAVAARARSMRSAWRAVTAGGGLRAAWRWRPHPGAGSGRGHADLE